MLRFRMGTDMQSKVKVMMKMRHMGPELQNSVKEGSRDQLYGKLTVRHHVFRNYVSPNRTRPVFGLFGLQTNLTNFKTRLWTRDTCHMYSEGTCG